MLEVLALLATLGIVLWGGGYVVLRWLWHPVRRAGFDPRARLPTLEPGHRFDPASSVTVRCGAHVGRRHATGPLSTVTMDATWLHLTGASLPDVWIHRGSVTSVELIRGRLGPAGLMFHSPDGEFDAVLLMAPRCVTPLRELGWPLAP